MDLELLDRLEDKVDVCVTTVRDLRAENESLRAETRTLEDRVASLTRDLESRGAAHADAESLRSRCADLERKLERVRTRIEAMVGKIKTLEG